MASRENYVSPSRDSASSPRSERTVAADSTSTASSTPNLNPKAASNTNTMDSPPPFWLTAECKPKWPPIPIALQRRGITTHKCCCPYCEGELWYTLASKHTCDPDIVDKRGVIKRTRVDAWAIGRLLQFRIERLVSGQLTMAETRCLIEIRQFINLLVVTYRHGINRSYPKWKPDLVWCGENLSWLLFGGCMNHISYQWEAPSTFSLLGPGTLGRSVPGDDFDTIVINSDALYHGSQDYGSCTPEELPAWLLSVVVHEQVHILIHRYLCTGHCEGVSSEWKEICSYLSHRMVWMYTHVDCGGLTSRVDHVFKDHGPAFTAITRILRTAMGKLFHLDFSHQRHGAVKECGPDCGDACLSHCYPDESGQIKLTAERNRWPEKRKAP